MNLIRVPSDKHAQAHMHTHKPTSKQLWYQTSAWVCCAAMIWSPFLKSSEWSRKLIVKAGNVVSSGRGQSSWVRLQWTESVFLTMWWVDSCLGVILNIFSSSSGDAQKHIFSLSTVSAHKDDLTCLWKNKSQLKAFIFLQLGVKTLTLEKNW